jgi:tetratricopeptide (TPR) repeat protein
MSATPGSDAPALSDLAQALVDARALRDANDLTAAHELARQVWKRSADAEQGIEAGVIACSAAFRLGELGNAIEAGEQVLALLRPGAVRPQRFDVLAQLAVAYGELARYDDAIGAVLALFDLSDRTRSLRDVVRARGTAAACFALIGDPWAAHRLMSEVADQLGALRGESRVEATARVNTASICLLAARMARNADDRTGMQDMLDAAVESIERTSVIARELGDARIEAFAQVHACEAALLRGEFASTLPRVRAAVEQLSSVRLPAQERWLRLFETEILIEQGDATQALQTVQPLVRRLGPNHELSVRIRVLDLLARATAANGDAPRALTFRERYLALEQHRSARQLRAVSFHHRARADIERWCMADLPAPSRPPVG